MAEDEQALAERRLGGGNPPIHLLRRQAEIALGERLALADLLVLVPGQNLNVHTGAFTGRELVKLFASYAHTNTSDEARTWIVSDRLKGAYDTAADADSLQERSSTALPSV